MPGYIVFFSQTLNPLFWKFLGDCAGVLGQYYKNKSPVNFYDTASCVVPILSIRTRTCAFHSTSIHVANKIWGTHWTCSVFINTITFSWYWCPQKLLLSSRCWSWFPCKHTRISFVIHWKIKIIMLELWLVMACLFLKQEKFLFTFTMVILRKPTSTSGITCVRYSWFSEFYTLCATSAFDGICCFIPAA